MFHSVIFLIVGICKVFAEDLIVTSEPEPIVHGLSASTFLDDNGYIRLNLSWEKINYGAEHVSIYFTNTEECNPINDVENYPLTKHFIIEPSMELEHPADDLIHGCSYNITLKDKRINKTQILTYKVPDCVEDKCRCVDLFESPNKLISIKYVSEGLFMVSWNKSTDANVTVHYIYYQRKDMKNGIRTYIPEANLRYVNDGVEIPLHDLKKDITYTITVVFIDEYNECMYLESLDYTERGSERNLSLLVVCGISVFLTLLLVYIILRCNPKIRKNLKKYAIFLSRSYEEYENQESATPLSEIKCREELNAQYTPLEFVLKMHKYDRYEFPRNKVILRQVIGEGAFGKVYFAKAYEIDGNPGFTMVAVKQLKGNKAHPTRELLDFEGEIETLKRIGSHDNIVRLLGCVTMEKPLMMIMELVPCGSLKQYLLKLRKKVGGQKNARTFFPDNMEEHWLKVNNSKQIEGQINYTKCIFDNTSCSYIVPDGNVPSTPNTPDSAFMKNTAEADGEPARLGTSRFLRVNNNNNQPAQTPRTPSSFTSSRLPSSTETALTNLETETFTPSMEEIKLLDPVLDHTELQQFAFQIANGMAWLEKIPITHRDLAARNILITSDKVLKISDYGMSRPGPYVNQKSKKVPLRWMAIESIEVQKWDNKSDVWSFGVVLWEIGTLAGFPYEQIPDVRILQELRKGRRLERPKICTDELYALMLQCWSEDPGKRPSFPN
ncbi:hypothetical protein NQ318_019340 [Aromia moschata]|uniref:Protein kinase domain-containing protein n=1 Tax=Aromia moschata TaxID=1265417 RepID=A0AAV8YBK7_9CUCU|nr:hypothetical protein NQ318_019340 [Aromia moschata]